MIKLNGNPLEFKKYPNNESIFPAINLSSAKGLMIHEVTLLWEGDEDLTRLMMVARFLDDRGWGTAKSLNIPYMPYSRMDRSEGGSAFSLRFVTDFINSLGFHDIRVGECHSDVTMALLRNAREVMYTPHLVEKVLFDKGLTKAQVGLYFPDAGAEKRYAKLFKGFQYCVGRKQRDFSTGEIKSIHTDFSFTNTPSHIIMVDDICSYGGTFVGGADAFRRAMDCTPPDGLFTLVVAHCEDSILKGKIPDDGRFSSVYTTDSLGKLDHPKIKQFPAM